ncbi:MAG TPA: winged helix-turn-helix domain-containing protein [Virgibacillus sp.]|nr:winged helix-turn-helix domain-containing protein [Virgibacillus sp.]HLR65550.1 winged helix-turn-helix domain-containing protein [Virgibacillus sp.]
MVKDANISFDGTRIEHPARIAMLMALTDGRSLPVSDLADIAGVTHQTARAHVTTLVEGFVLTVENPGRHRYYKLSSPQVKEAVHAIAKSSPSIQVHPLRESNDKKALYAARTCYGHLAGKLGLKLTESLIKLGYVEDLEDKYRLTEKGKQWIYDFKAIPPQKVNEHSIPYHIDWTERKHHIAGPFALAITKRLLDLGWIQEGSIRRSIQVTEIGRFEIWNEFGFDPFRGTVPRRMR